MLYFCQDHSKQQTHELKIVKQTYDINAETPDKIYQFVPNYLEINTGDSIKFLRPVNK